MKGGGGSVNTIYKALTDRQQGKACQTRRVLSLQQLWNWRHDGSLMFIFFQGNPGVPLLAACDTTLEA